MTFTRRLADRFRSAPYDQCICQRAKGVELIIKVILHDDVSRRNYYNFEFLHVGTSRSKTDMKRFPAFFHPLIDAFVT